MAEEDLDFGDDDLELDDDSGDDFAGELDDMMGDDELGGDAGGGGSDSDSELDSFFEDLSSIEDMDDSGGGDEDEADEADFSPPDEEVSEKPAPAKKKEKPKKEKAEGGGGKLKFVILFIVLLLGGGGFGAYWFLLRPPEVAVQQPVPAEEAPTPVPQITMPVKQPIKIEQPKQRILPEPIIPTPAKPAEPKRSYLIQVAKCSYDACKEEYINALREDGEPVYQKSDGEKYDFIELVSRQVYGRERAQSIINRINRQNRMAGNASIRNQSNGYRVSMGTFPALDRAKEVKFHIEKVFPQKEISFNLEHVRKDYTATKIFAGPYDSRKEAKSVLRELKKKSRYRGAFLTRTTDPI